MVTVTKELARFKIEVSQMKDLESSNGMSIVVDVEDGLKFACIDFSSQKQKRRKALCIQTDLF